MFVLAPKKKDTVTPKLNKFLLSSVADVIRDGKFKKELIDVMNKHIEYLHEDSMPRIKYDIPNIKLAEYVNDFLSANNGSFNQDLAIIVNRYINKNYSSAEGDPIIGIGMNMQNTNKAFQDMSTIASKNHSNADGNEDEIKLSLINKGIKKAKIWPMWIKLLVIAVVVGIVIWLLIKYNKVEIKPSGQTDIKI